MKRWLLSLCIGLLAVVIWPAGALAQSQDSDSSKKPDPRLSGYKESVALEEKSTSLIWLMMIFLSVCATAVVFKNAKRTHLD